MCAHIGGYDRDLQFVAWRHDLTRQCVWGAKKLHTPLEFPNWDYHNRDTHNKNGYD